MIKLDKRLLVNISKTTAATALLSVAPSALACGLTWLFGIGNGEQPESFAVAVATVAICTYWLYFKRGRNFKQSITDGGDYFDFLADKVKHKNR